MSAHTPGPWHVDIKDGDGYLMRGDDLEVYAGDPEGDPDDFESIVFVDLDTGLDGEEGRRAVQVAEANARLIAAAPDLAKALEDVLTWFDPELRQAVADQASQRNALSATLVLGKARAALAKAGVKP